MVYPHDKHKPFIPSPPLVSTGCCLQCPISWPGESVGAAPGGHYVYVYIMLYVLYVYIVLLCISHYIYCTIYIIHIIGLYTLIYIYVLCIMYMYMMYHENPSLNSASFPLAGAASTRTGRREAAPLADTGSTGRKPAANPSPGPREMAGWW
jgi:hypothetical protein